MPLWLTLLIGVGLAGWGAGEFRVALGTSADAADVDLVALEKGGEPPQNHIRVGPHVSLYTGAIYGYNEKNKGLTDPPIDFAIYPIVSKDNPYFTLLRDRMAAGDEPGRVADMRFPPTDRLRMLVLTRKYRKASEIPARIESRGVVTGLLVNSVRSLEKRESDLLRQSYPDLDLAKTLILEEDRKPKSALAALLISGVGWIVVLLTAIGFFRRVFGKTIPTAQSTR